MVEHASVVRITYLEPVDGKRDELLAVLRRVAETTRSAEGNFGAQACSADDRPDAVVEVSRWRDRSDLDAFLRERGQEILDVVGPLLSAAPEPRHYTSLSD